MPKLIGVSLLLTLITDNRNNSGVLPADNNKTLLGEEANPNCSCGVTDPLAWRITGGTPTSITEHPWQVLVLYRGQLFCGGSIINNRYVLTAGHCANVSQTSKMSVLMGVTNRISDSGSKREFNVVEVIKHENFLSTDFYDLRDIALLKLNDIIIFNQYIQPVCLPPQGADYKYKMATITGWGMTRFKGGRTTRVLRKARVKVWSKHQCLKSKLGEYVAEDTESMFCAYGRQMDACQGDSGGPLVYEDQDGTSFLIGIVSWGDMCGMVGFPGIYTKVSTFHNWIRQHTTDATYCVTPHSNQPISNYY